MTNAYHIVFDALPTPDGPRFIEIENDAGRSITAGEWRSRADGLAELVLPAPELAHPIDTAPAGVQIIAHEAMYGWLIVCKQPDGSFHQKSSGNFWMDVPPVIQFTHWLPYPGSLTRWEENSAEPKAPIAYGDDRHVAATVALAEAGIPTDVQELLIYGDATRGIPPNALIKALEVAARYSTPPPQSHAQGTDRDDGITFGIAMSVAFLIRDRDEPSIAREWWGAAGLTIEQCERVGLDEYDLAPIRAALADTAAEDGR